jgi:predicted esterase
VDKRFGKLPVTIVGTSEGSVSAYYAALALQQQVDGKVIFTSSLFRSSQNSQGLDTLDFTLIRMPILWVHHEYDPCSYTPYSSARRLAEKTRSPLITVRAGKGASGDSCQARTQHGFIGAEKETVQAMKRWILSGEAQDVNE